MPKAKIFTAITAAGDSRRMGRSKALLPWGENTFLSAMLTALSKAGLCGSNGVVVGDDEAGLYEEIVRSGAELLVNQNPSEGRFSSIQIAARWALDSEVDTQVWTSLLLWPVDCPGVDYTILARLCRESLFYPNDNIVPTFANKNGHPVVLCESMLRKIAATEGNANLRELMSDGTVGRRFCPVADSAILDNINRPEEYARFLKTRTPPPRVNVDHG